MKLLILLTITTVLLSFGHTIAQTSHTDMRGISGLEIAAEMAPGVNLWNTLDANCGPNAGLESEICWGNPYTTPEMVQAFADRGFKTLRLPVTWYNHMDTDYIIDSAWMDRVEEVANYAFNANMYVIINMHHEDYDETKKGTWLSPTYEKQEQVTEQLVKVWMQIATRFKDYGDYLILETMNEPREVGHAEEWSGGTAEHRDVVNQFNQAAVDAIRATGGNNKTRFILIPQVVANPGTAMTDLIIPNNDSNIMVSMHNYNPYSFCLQDDGTNQWGTTGEKNTLRDDILSYSDHFVKNGRAIILGEWGAGNKDNYADRVTYYDVFARACAEGGITPISWIYEFNRKKLIWEYPMLEDAILRAFNENTVVVEELILNSTLDTLLVGETLQLSAEIVPFEAVSSTIIWTSYDKEVATIDDNGLITAIGGGKTNITATVVGMTSKCRITVVDTLTSMHGQAFENNLRVYPNPTTDLLNIELNETPSQIKIYAIDGKLIVQKTVNNTDTSIDVSTLKSGTYLLKVNSKNNNYTNKFLIQ